MWRAEDYDRQHHGNFDRDDDVVECGAFLRAAREQCGKQQYYAGGRQIEKPMRWRFAAVSGAGEIGVRELSGNMYAKALHDLVEIARPADGDSRRPRAIFKHQIPADDPGENLAKRCVSVSVGASRNRNQRGEFGITERDEGAGRSREQERNHHARPGDIRGDRAGEHEDAGADDPANAERHQGHPAQCAFKPLFFSGVIGGDNGFD